MRIADVLNTKGSSVLTTAPDTFVTDLLAALAERNVGAAVVLDQGRLAGIVSERDVVRRLHERGADLLAAPVAEIMTSVLTTCRPGDGVESLSVLMTERRVRHVPVVDDEGGLAGIVSIGDVVKSHIETLQEHREQLEAYIVQG